MKVLMPEDGSLVRWHRAAGERVQAGTVLCEVETDKTVMEVEAPEAGVLRHILVQEGQSGLAAGQPLAEIGALDAVQDAGGAVEALLAGAVCGQTAPVPGFLRSSPLARRLAREAGLELAGIAGTGPGGRIVERDVIRHAGTRIAAPEASSPANVRGALRIARDYAGCPHERRPIDSMRRTIAERLLESKQTIPHFYLSRDVRADALLALRSRLRAESGSRLTVNDFLVRAHALALAEVAEANVVWADDAILAFRQVDLGVAVAVEGGLYTPVVRRADEKSVFEISDEIRELAARARQGGLLPAEYRGGTSSVSNLGMQGVKQFGAVINPPQSSILAVGACEPCIAVVEGRAAVVMQMTVTLSCDHRVIDGSLGARVLDAFKRRVENPEQMLA